MPQSMAPAIVLYLEQALLPVGAGDSFVPRAYMSLQSRRACFRVTAKRVGDMLQY